MNENLPGADFERELTLDELLKGVDGVRLASALRGLLQAPAAIVDETGRCLIGAEQPGSADRTPLFGELEAIGFLSVPPGVPNDRLRAAAEMIQLILRSNARYRLASDLHLRTQRDDFEELQRKNAALKASEARYKKLAETLEERVEAQVQTIEKAHLKLYRNEKQASVGRLAAGVAHEINNPLGFIRSNITTAVSYLASLSEIDERLKDGAVIENVREFWAERDFSWLLADFKDLMNESVDGLDRIARIVAALKGFSRTDHHESEQADIDTIVRQVHQISESQWRHKADVLLDLNAATPIYCRPAQLGQVVYGLLCNALDAIEKSGAIRIRTKHRGTMIVLEVQDGGCGIPEPVLPHVFEPFFTTKDVGQGTGLGLTVCHDIVEEHRGTIDIVSQVGRGTRVTVTLPCSGGPMQQAD